RRSHSSPTYPSRSSTPSRACWRCRSQRPCSGTSSPASRESLPMSTSSPPRSIDMPTTPSAVDVLVHPLHDLDELISAHSYDLVIGHTDDLDPRTLRRVIESSATAAVTTTEKTVLRLAEPLCDDHPTNTLHTCG